MKVKKVKVSHSVKSDCCDPMDCNQENQRWSRNLDQTTLIFSLPLEAGNTYVNKSSLLNFKPDWAAFLLFEIDYSE